MTMMMQKSATNRLRASQPRPSCALSRPHGGRRGGLAASCSTASNSNRDAPCRVNISSSDAASSVSRSESIPVTMFLAAAALGVLVSTSAPSPALAEEIYSAGPSQYRYPAAERYSEQQEGRFDEYLQTAELKSLLEMLTSGGSPKLQDLEQARLKVGSWGGLPCGAGDRGGEGGGSRVTKRCHAAGQGRNTQVWPQHGTAPHRAP